MSEVYGRVSRQATAWKPGGPIVCAMAMTLTGYTIAMSGPQPARFTHHLTNLGANLSEPPRALLLRLVVRRQIHAAAFANGVALAALLNLAERTGLRANLLAAFASDVIAAGAVDQLAERGIPVLIGRSTLEDALAAALLGRRRDFSAGGVRFVLQGNALHIDGTIVVLDAALASLLRTLADHAGATLSRATLARLCVMSRSRATGIESAIGQLRTALGERSWLIATVSRRGYRLALEGAAGSRVH